MFSAIRSIHGPFEAGSLIEMKTRGYSIRARGDQGLTNRPDIWEHLRSPTAAIEEKNALQTGGSPYMGISKRGDTYLRTLLIHGARAVAKTAAKKTDAQSRWINELVKRRNANIAAVAVANKNARVIRTLLRRDEGYRVRA